MTFRKRVTQRFAVPLSGVCCASSFVLFPLVFAFFLPTGALKVKCSENSAFEALNPKQCKREFSCSFGILDSHLDQQQSLVRSVVEVFQKTQ